MFAASNWPDQLDASVTAAYLACILVMVSGGYLCMVVDVRAHLRRIKGALILASRLVPERPAWAESPTPRCIAVFGLDMPCSEADLLVAYRAKVKHLHPDRGGDRRDFLRLQSHFEEALRLLRSRPSVVGPRLR